MLKKKTKLLFLMCLIALFMPIGASATITFNGNSSMTDALRDDGGVYTNLGTSSFNYFDDTAVENDSIVFGWDRSIFQGIFLTVGTPLNASDINITWEFYNETLDDWSELANVTDGTSNFNHTGLITWNVPDHWKALMNLGGIATANGCFVRARITGVSGLTEGGAQGAVIPQLRDFTIRLNGANSLEDIYNNNTANGWGIVNRYGGEDAKFYHINCNLKLGDVSDGILNIDNWEILQLGSEERRVIFMTRVSYGNELNMGVKSAGTYGDNYEQGGSLFYYNFDPCIQTPYNVFYAKWSMYRSRYWKSGGSFCDPAIAVSVGGEISYSSWECKNNNFFVYTSQGCCTNMSNSIISTQGDYYLYIYTNNFLVENLMFASSRGTLSTKSVTYEGIDYQAGRQHYCAGASTQYLKNCIFETGFFDQVLGNVGNRHCFQTYTLDFLFINETGDEVSDVNVTIINNLSEELYNGIWAGELDVNVRQENISQIVYLPLNISIVKDGYQTINTLYNLEEETTFEAVLMGEVTGANNTYLTYPNANGIILTDNITFGINWTQNVSNCNYTFLNVTYNMTSSDNLNWLQNGSTIHDFGTWYNVTFNCLYSDNSTTSISIAYYIWSGIDSEILVWLAMFVIAYVFFCIMRKEWIWHLVGVSLIWLNTWVATQILDSYLVTAMMFIGIIVMSVELMRFANNIMYEREKFK